MAQRLAAEYENAAIEISRKNWNERATLSFLKRMTALTGPSAAGLQTVTAYLGAWLASSDRQRSASKTLLNYKGIIEDFCEFLVQGGMAEATLLELESSVIAAFREREISRGKADATINKALSVLGRAFKDAKAKKLIDANPCEDQRIRNVRSQKRKFFTFEQFRDLARKLDGRAAAKQIGVDWAVFVRLAGYTGARQQEVAKLEWRNVDFDSGKITFNRSKTGDTHEVPLHASLRSALAQQAKRTRKEKFVMPQIAAAEERELSKTFREQVLPLVGIHQPYSSLEGKGVGRKLAEYSIHSFRHSLSTWLDEAGVDEMQRMRLIGHEDVDVSRGYTHTDLGKAAAALAKVPAV